MSDQRGVQPETLADPSLAAIEMASRILGAHLQVKLAKQAADKANRDCLDLWGEASDMSTSDWISLNQVLKEKGLWAPND